MSYYFSFRILFSPAFSISVFYLFALTHETASNSWLYTLSRSLAFILHFTGTFGRLQIFFICYNHVEKEFSKTPAKVCKDVPFTVINNVDWIGGQAQVIKQRSRFFFLFGQTFLTEGHCCSFFMTQSLWKVFRNYLMQPSERRALHWWCLWFSACSEWAREMHEFCGQMCMKSGANGVRSRASGRGQGAGLCRIGDLPANTHIWWFTLLPHT